MKEQKFDRVGETYIDIFIYFSHHFSVTLDMTFVTYIFVAYPQNRDSKKID